MKFLWIYALQLRRHLVPLSTHTAAATAGHHAALLQFFCSSSQHHCRSSAVGGGSRICVPPLQHRPAKRVPPSPVRWPSVLFLRSGVKPPGWWYNWPRIRGVCSYHHRQPCRRPTPVPVTSVYATATSTLAWSRSAKLISFLRPAPSAGFER